MNETYFEPQYSPSIKSVINIFKSKRELGFFYSNIIKERYELAYITEGALQMSINGMTFKLSPYDLYIKKPNDYSSIHITDSAFVKYMIINFQIYEGILSNIAGKIYHLDTEQQFMIRELYDIFSATFANSKFHLEPKKDPDIIAQKTAFLKLEIFLLSLLKTRNLDPSEIVMQNIGAHNYKKINDIMHENLEKKLTVPEIATLCNMSVANIQKTMALYANCGVMKYFTSLKISRAINLLKSGATIGETCDFLGFSSQSYFSQVFKRETGKSPKDYLKS